MSRALINNTTRLESTQRDASSPSAVNRLGAPRVLGPFFPGPPGISRAASHARVWPEDETTHLLAPLHVWRARRTQRHPLDPIPLGTAGSSAAPPLSSPKGPPRAPLAGSQARAWPEDETTHLLAPPHVWRARWTQRRPLDPLPFGSASTRVVLPQLSAPSPARRAAPRRAAFENSTSRHTY